MALKQTLIEAKSSPNLQKLDERLHDELSFSAPKIRDGNFAQHVAQLSRSPEPYVELFHGDTSGVLAGVAANSIDCVITSPPYWGHREYDGGGIGLEANPEDYIRHLCDVFDAVHRVLKPTGSFWLNIGDTYNKKALVGIPWRVALELTDRRGWFMRNSVVWNKVKGGMDNTRDRLGNAHENVFHFVKQTSGYFYDANAIRSKPRESKVVNGAVVSATGVSGVRYKRQIELSTELSSAEKSAAFEALNDILQSIAEGAISDFRMIIRGQQRTTHSDSTKLSGRAKELVSKGFYFLKYHPNGSKPTDVWDILPEDTQKRALHFAPFPVDLCRIPISATCPENGIVLDPFAGTGSALIAAHRLKRKAIGIDICREYLELAGERLLCE